MKFKTRFALKDREGEEKVVRKFSLLPRSFGEDKERVWLETVDIVYQIKKVGTGSSEYCPTFDWKWIPVRFATDKDKQELPFEKTFDDGYNMFEHIIRNPYVWIVIDMAIILIIASTLKDTVMSTFMMIKIIHAISLVMFGERSNEK